MLQPLDYSLAWFLTITVNTLVGLGVFQLLLTSSAAIQKRRGSSFVIALGITALGLVLLFNFVVIWFFLGVMS